MNALWLLLIPACLILYLVYSSLWGKPLSVRILFNRYFMRFVLKNPELLSTIGIPLKEGQLGDASTRFMRQILQEAKRELAILRSYNKRRMRPDVLLSARIMEWFLDDMVSGESYLLHGYPVNQMFGMQSELPDFMTTIHKVQSIAGARHYIQRIRQFGRVFSQVVAGLKEREEIGVVAPRFVHEKVIQEMKGFISTDAASNLLYTSFAEKLEKIKASPAQKKVLLSDCEQAIQDQVYPAYQDLIACCEHLQAVSTHDDGVWKLPSGEEYYAYQLRSHTTSAYPPAKVHAIGLSEVDRIEKEMKAILKKEGYKDPDPIALLTDFSQEERFLYPNTDKGRSQALADYQGILDHIHANLGHLFNKRPKAELKVERVPEFKEKTAAGAYYMIPSLDGKRPGIFYANLRDMNEVQKFGMRTLAYHEGIPGHHFQLALAQEIRGVPIFRRVIPFTAYAEGWALYAEKLAREQGFLPDAYSELGYLQSELTRAVRLVVDTGIHSQRWTREKAIAYMVAHTGLPEASVVSEVERYIVMPGQACAYKIGELKMVELRRKAMDALGEHFDIREFHDVVLGNGSMPLEILEGLVQEYIEKKHKTIQQV